MDRALPANIVGWAPPTKVDAKVTIKFAGRCGPAPTDLLERCPRCDYLLEGLPVEHRCPECGLPVDRTWHVFGRQAVWRSSGRGLVTFVLCLMGFAGALPLIVGGLTGASRVVVWGIPGLFALVVMPLLLWAFAVRPRGFVAVGARGVTVYRSKKRVDEYTWDRVGKAHFRLTSKTLDLRIDDQPVVIPAFRIFRGNIFEVERCIRYMNAYPRDQGRSGQ